MNRRAALAAFILAIVPAVALAWGSKPPPPATAPTMQEILMKSIQPLVDFFVWAETWVFPHLPIHISVLDTILALDTCAAYRKAMGKSKHPWLQVFVGAMICCFGGTTLTAILLGQPAGWLGSITSPGAYMIGFWMIFCCPGDVPYKAITRIFPLSFVMNILNCISGAHAVTSWGAEKALHAFHLGATTMVAAEAGARVAYAASGPYTLLCGTLSGCGGGILGKMLACDGSADSWAFSTPPVLRRPTTTFKLAALSSVIYYLIRNPHDSLPWDMDLLPIDVTKTLIWGLWVAVYIAGDVCGVEDPLAWMMPAFGPCLMLPGEIGGETTEGIYEAVAGVDEAQAKKKQ